MQKYPGKRRTVKGITYYVWETSDGRAAWIIPNASGRYNAIRTDGIAESVDFANAAAIKSIDGWYERRRSIFV